ncbi:8-oxo-dGTP pyrophosphatase MutT (NUDIX family) [Nocardia transvalensis]|uniref:8-oxo-dGTP pyrophosphatase MutT (NUDIX family) n=1 Tax=Nocardia transvalensis TaxID=37333 RepID=A0A7W9PHP8_9NOCA|nr:CoA pyrophosphatase [Nocardia transvalensis]MBB5916120.1 8-oxo-dGTP pyrophosphatase MutT (NUDIX family) [Nocardia transvalensis]
MDQRTLTDALREFRPVEIPLDGRRAAAIAIPVGVLRGEPVVCLTKRSSTLRAHPGQYAFPGGRLDSGETAVEAALRELSEELGVQLTGDDVLGRLDDFATKSGYVMSPFVVWIGDGVEAIHPNPDEVAHVYAVTLDEVDVDPIFVSDPAVEEPVVQWPFRGALVHAPTAAVLHQFREVALHARHTRVAHFGQPVFAWR